jgi:hypothetical protein
VPTQTRKKREKKREKKSLAIRRTSSKYVATAEMQASTCMQQSIVNPSVKRHLMPDSNAVSPQIP